MNMIHLIEQKRDGAALTSAEIGWFVQQVTQETVPDYQVAALLMAIYLRGMGDEETTALTVAMAGSGDQLDLHDIAPRVVDKHSSGGVGDKTTLVVAPLVAACGVPVGKMSGRGLGISGGTLDKLESFPGWRSDLTLAQFRHQLAQIGIVLAGQSADLAPADGKLYALRDVTGTVASIPLIAASIMSKKLAAGADAIVLDVKVGSGAFMRDVPSATRLAQVMVAIGRNAGRETVALLSDMNQPLGHAVGNALEVREALQMLRGELVAPDFEEHCLEIAAHMLVLAGQSADLPTAHHAARTAIQSGAALHKFRALIAAQGGDATQVDQPEPFAQAPFQQPIHAPRAGWIASIDTGAVGMAAVELGGGRKVKSDLIDHRVGFVLPCKVGGRVVAGDLLGTIHAAREADIAPAREAILAAIGWSDQPVQPLPAFHGLVR
jgi:pyrimidine-nucleoside phosphorylase